MSSSFGHCVKVQIFGCSHGKAIGVVIDGLPTGETVDTEELTRFMQRRRPGASRLTTARNEKDVPEFISGLEDGTLTGSPLCAVIYNSDARSSSYSEFLDKPRPSHADFTALLRYGPKVDMRGSGHFSGRLTAPLCVAGGIAKQILARRGIEIGAHLLQIENVKDSPFPLFPDRALFDKVLSHPLPVIDESAAKDMAQAVENARMQLDSVGGIIECAVTGLKGGLGTPMFDGVENRLAEVLFGIPAVRGLEFGAGFKAAEMRGSEHNDPFVMENGTVMTLTNNHGGIIGGITTGMPVVFRLAFKPTPSIAREQRTVSLSQRENTTLSIKGRHDPCVAIRAVPVVEAAAASVILDILMEAEHGPY